MTKALLVTETVAEDTTVIGKDIDAAFALDETKLARLLDVMEQRFKEAGLTFKPSFATTLQSGREVTTDSIKKLMAFDNPIKNPIVSLEIKATAWEPETLSFEIGFYGRRYGYIGLKVAATDNKRASQSYAELEEQVERTFNKSLMHKLRVGPILGFLFGVFMVSLFAMLIVLPDARTSTILTTEEVQAFNRKASQAVSVEDKLNLLYEIEMRQLKRPDVGRGNLKMTRFLTVKNLFLALPIIIILVCLIYLRLKFYPRAAFLWGDYKDHYNKLVNTRRAIWTVVIAALFVGILGNLFVLGISPSIR